MRLGDGDGEVRLPGGMASRIRGSRVGSRGSRRLWRPFVAPDGVIQGDGERPGSTALGLMFPIPPELTLSGEESDWTGWDRMESTSDCFCDNLCFYFYLADSNLLAVGGLACKNLEATHIF